MDLTLQLCDKNLVGDIPTYEYKNIKESDYLTEAEHLIYHWLETKDFNKSVFVCFEDFENNPDFEYRDNIKSFTITHNWDDITDLIEYLLSEKRGYHVNFSIYEFGSYEDAFDYCKDLKQGL